MHIRSWVLAGLSLTWLTACYTSDLPSGPDMDDGASDGADDSAGDSADDGSADDGVDSTGEPGEGYPAEVLDHLDLPWPPYDYDPELPAHFAVPEVVGFDNTPGDNPTTDDGATLGRVLFYDVALSSNETISCASCHPQATGFSDTAMLSEGFEGGLTGRNSMGLANARFYAAGHFFWDERANTLEDQVLMPIQDPVEMGLTLEELVERVQAQPYYPSLFTRAFGDDTIDADRISRALAQFVRSMTSYRTAWDEGIAATGNPMADFPNLSAAENLGKAVFFGRGRCAPCHLGVDDPPAPGRPPGNLAVFMLTESANNGLDAQLVVADNGVGDVDGDMMLNGVFKSPSLRNIALTAPYMHDGRFATLLEVVEHYDNGVQPHPNLDPRLRGPDGQPQQLGLTPEEKSALVDFLEALTDDALVGDARFADPFVG